MTDKVLTKQILEDLGIDTTKLTPVSKFSELDEKIKEILINDMRSDATTEDQAQKKFQVIMDANTFKPIIHHKSSNLYFETTDKIGE